MDNQSKPYAPNKVALTTTKYKTIVTTSKESPNPENLIPKPWTCKVDVPSSQTRTVLCRDSRHPTNPLVEERVF